MAGVTVEEIVEYWASREDESGLAVDWSEAHERCWRCSYKSRLEKCHIVPDSLGGASTAGNLVLLCGRCHREAPNHENPRYMWVWLRATCVPFYDTYWTHRGWEEFETMFGRKPFDWVKDVELDEAELTAEFSALLRSEHERAVIHFGEGRMNPSSIACVMAEVERSVADKYGVTLSSTAVNYLSRRFFR